MKFKVFWWGVTFHHCRIFNKVPLLMNVYIALTSYRHGNTKRTSFHCYKNKPQGLKETNRKKKVTILEKFMEYYTYYVRIVMNKGLTHLRMN
jgi:hypothetical protein